MQMLLEAMALPSHGLKVAVPWSLWGAAANPNRAVFPVPLSLQGCLLFQWEGGRVWEQQLVGPGPRQAALHGTACRFSAGCILGTIDFLSTSSLVADVAARCPQTLCPFFPGRAQAMVGRVCLLKGRACVPGSAGFHSVPESQFWRQSGKWLLATFLAS